MAPPALPPRRGHPAALRPDGRPARDAAAVRGRRCRGGRRSATSSPRARDRYAVEVAVLRLLAGRCRASTRRAARSPTSPRSWPAAPRRLTPLAWHRPTRWPTTRCGCPTPDPAARPREVAWADARLLRGGPAADRRRPCRSAPGTCRASGGCRRRPAAGLAEGGPAVLRPRGRDAAPPRPRPRAAAGRGRGPASAARRRARRGPLGRGSCPVLLRVLELLVGLQVELGRRGPPSWLEVGAPDWRAAARSCRPSSDLVDRTGATARRRRTSRGSTPWSAGCRSGWPRSPPAGCRTPWCTATSTRATPAAPPAPGGRSVLLDWGDCGIGNPLLDQAAFLASIARGAARAGAASAGRTCGGPRCRAPTRPARPRC